MPSIAIHSKVLTDESYLILKRIFIAVEEYCAGYTILLSKTLDNTLRQYKKSPGKYEVYPNVLSEAEALISIGGDGTLLEAVTHVGSQEIPLLGINTGRMGFLSHTPKENVEEAIKVIVNKKFEIEERMLLRVDSDSQLFEGINYGLNEFTVLKQDTSSMITVHAYLDGDYLTSYWADGLIVATPTGSTGYSLSCNGPVVMPRSHSFILTPVSPHNLSLRPIVVSDSCKITLEIEGRSQYFLVSLDSRSQVVSSSIKFTISKEKFKTRLIKINNTSFADTLRNKLNWGYDVRN